MQNEEACEPERTEMPGLRRHRMRTCDAANTAARPENLPGPVQGMRWQGKDYERQLRRCWELLPALPTHGWSVERPSRATLTPTASPWGSLLAYWRRGPIDQEIIQPSASLNLRPKPSGSLPTAGPNLHWVFWISILRWNGRAARHVVGPLKRM